MFLPVYLEFAEFSERTFEGAPLVGVKKCLGWHFELEHHGSESRESIEQYWSKVLQFAKKNKKKSLFLPNCLRILIFLCNFAPNFLGASAQHANAYIL